MMAVTLRWGTHMVGNGPAPSTNPGKTLAESALPQRVRLALANQLRTIGDHFRRHLEGMALETSRSLSRLTVKDGRITGEQRVVTEGLSLTADWDVNEMLTLRSITATRRGDTATVIVSETETDAAPPALSTVHAVTVTCVPAAPPS